MSYPRTVIHLSMFYPFVTSAVAAALGTTAVFPMSICPWSALDRESAYRPEVRDPPC